MEKSYHLHCTGNCDNQVIWGDGSNFSTSGDYEVMSLSRGTRCVDIQNYARAPYLNDLRGSACSLLRTKTICQIPCEKGNFCIHGTYLNDAVSSSPYTVPSECPEDFPFATNNGGACCKFYKRAVNTSNPICNGASLEFEDPLECCSDHQPCNDSDLGCKDHYRKNGND